jgi:hypothetical protein
MSHHLVNGTMRLKMPGLGLRKWVLCVLSHQAVQSTGEVSLTMADLAEICDLSVSCVRDHVKHLHHAGMIEAVLLRNSSVYRIRVRAA